MLATWLMTAHQWAPGLPEPEASRHRLALRWPHKEEEPVRNLILGWAQMADLFRSHPWGSGGIGSDPELGAAWSAIGAAIPTLLLPECERFDYATLCRFIDKALEVEGQFPGGRDAGVVISFSTPTFPHGRRDSLYAPTRSRR